jgi:cyclopropane fatty-acyl-phospholipid synthase-like methyltransferase
MDKWKYYDISHKWHLLCNPVSEEKFERLCKLLKLRQGARVLDIACGKGEFLIRLAELYGISGVGVDISPYCIKDCLQKHQNRTPNADIKFIEMDGAKYQPETWESFDLAMCIGASWVFGNYRGTLQALKKMTKPSGLIIVGEPFWLKEPSEEYLKMEGFKREDYGTHMDNVKVGEEEGLSCLYTIVSNQDDWDHYETLQWWAIDQYIKAHPDDPDIPELLERKKREEEAYLRWRRETLGWAIYVFRKQDYKSHQEHGM